MRHLVIIIGLPGSGKTELARLGYSTYRLIDDPSRNCTRSEVIDALETEDYLVIADPYLCDPESLQILQGLIKDHVEWDLSVMEALGLDLIYFKNEPEVCLANDRSRPSNRQAPNTIRNLSKVYNPPSKALSCFR